MDIQIQNGSDRIKYIGRCDSQYKVTKNGIKHPELISDLRTSETPLYHWNNEWKQYTNKSTFHGIRYLNDSSSSNRIRK